MDVDSNNSAAHGVNDLPEESNVEIVWNEFKNYCLSELSKEDCAAKTYMDSCRPVSLDDGVLVLAAKTSFARDQIESRFLDRIKALFLETGFGTDVSITVQKEEDASAAGAPAQSAKPEKRIQRDRRISVRPGDSALNPNYVFSTFVVGKSNNLAYAMSLAVAEAPGVSYNPLFIWGGVGLGKTHLMHAIGHYIADRDQNKKILYVSAEKFTNELIYSLMNKAGSQFRSRYRELDVLMIDDIQFIAGKDSTQEEFFHTFNTLHNANKQIIISADRPPKDIPDIQDRLVTRFEMGLVTDIQQPDLETRIAILQKKAELKKYVIPDDVIYFIAQNVQSNIRELEGSLNRVVACSEFNSEPMNTENVAIWLKDLIRSNKHGPVSINLIQQMTADSFGISVEDMLSQSRTADIALARQIAMYLARNKTEESLQQIGSWFNKKDHTTVIHACKKINDMVKTDLRVKTIVDNIVSKL